MDLTAAVATPAVAESLADSQPMDALLACVCGSLISNENQTSSGMISLQQGSISMPLLIHSNFENAHFQFP